MDQKNPSHNTEKSRDVTTLSNVTTSRDVTTLSNVTTSRDVTTLSNVTTSRDVTKNHVTSRDGVCGTCQRRRATSRWHVAGVTARVGDEWSGGCLLVCPGSVHSLLCPTLSGHVAKC